MGEIYRSILSYFVLLSPLIYIYLSMLLFLYFIFVYILLLCFEKIERALLD